MRGMKVRSRLSKHIHLLVIVSYFRSLSIRKSACVNGFLVRFIISRLDPDVYTIFRPPYWSTKEVLQHGGSIPGSIILRGTLIFRRISRLWDNAHTLYLENRLLYLSSIISQFLGFVHRMFFYSVFNCVTMIGDLLHFILFRPSQ